MTAWTYTTLTAQLQNYLQEDPTQPGTTAFQNALPTIISNAELRIYTDLDFLSTRRQNATLAFVAGVRTLDLSTTVDTTDFPNYPVVVQGIAAILPSGDNPAGGQRVAYEPASLDFIDMIWPSEAFTAPPTEGFGYYAMLSDTLAVVAPTPDDDYTAEVTGTWRPAPMSATNPTTWLGTNLPQLLFAACMVEGTGFQRDFGSQASDPKVAMSWDAEYGKLKDLALQEEQRRKGSSTGWSAMQQTLATPPRA